MDSGQRDTGGGGRGSTCAFFEPPSSRSDEGARGFQSQMNYETVGTLQCKDRESLPKLQTGTRISRRWRFMHRLCLVFGSLQTGVCHIRELYDECWYVLCTMVTIFVLVPTGFDLFVAAFDTSPWTHRAFRRRREYK